MRTAVIITGLTAALATALPAYNTTLEARGGGKVARVLQFPGDDDDCKASKRMEFPGLKDTHPKAPLDKCVIFNRRPDTTVRVHWGKGDKAADKITFYYDPECKGLGSGSFEKEDMKDGCLGLGHIADGAGSSAPYMAIKMSKK